MRAFLLPVAALLVLLATFSKPTSPVSAKPALSGLPPVGPVLSQSLPELAPEPPAQNLPHFSYRPQPKLLWTFDDCENRPGEGVVANFVRILEDHQVKTAIFFMTGNCYYSRPDLVGLIRKAGYEIGNHTKTHADLTKLPVAKIDAEIQGGPPGARYFRAPFGASNPLVDGRIKAAGLIKLGWGASGGDSGVTGLTRSCDRILEDLVHTSDPGDAVLLHMYNPNSPWALQAYLAGRPNCEQ